MKVLLGISFLLLVSGGFAFPDQRDYGEYDYKYDASSDADAKIYEDETFVEKEQPRFVDKPGKITVIEGEPVKMPCKTMKPTEDVLIFKKLPAGNKTEVLIYVGDMILKKESRFRNIDSVFTSNSVSRDDAGTYVCLYQVDRKTELRYELEVLYSPSVYAKEPEEQRVPKGSSVTLECEATGNPEPTITWSRMSGKFPSGASTEEGYSLTLQNVDRHVEGVYKCTADNGIGESASAAMTFLVEYPPEIITEKAIIRSGEGDKVDLVCLVHARPSANVYWTKDGLSPPFDNNMVEVDGGHRHSITINNVNENNFGSYQCHAQNSKGEETALINLTDIPKEPHFISPRMSADETSYILVWETESYYPITEYVVKIRQAKMNESTNVPGEWLQFNEEVSGIKDVETNGLHHKIKYLLTDLAPATDYEAKVSVKNQLKWGDEGSFNFSTRKETVGWQTGGSELIAVNTFILISTLAMNLFS